MTRSRAGTGALVAGAGGVVLFIALFLPWYSVSVEFAGESQSADASGWEALSTIDIILFLVAVLAVAFAAASAAGAVPAGNASQAAMAVAAAGGLALLLSVIRLIDIPADDEGIPGVDLGRKIGVFIAVLASAAVAYGGFRAMNEPSTAGPAAPPTPPPTPPTP